MSKLTDRLAAALEIRNEYHFLQLAQPDYSTGKDGPMGYTDRHATVRFVRDGKPMKMKTQFRTDETTNGHKARRIIVENAQKAASQRFGVTEWARLPWPDSWTWIPKDAYDRVITQLEAAEATARTQTPDRSTS